MPFQPSPPGSAPAALRSHRVFFALLPDARAAAQAAQRAGQLCRSHGLKAPWRARAERLHVTLLWLGAHAAFPARTAARAVEVAERVHLPAFRVCLDRAQSFSGRKALPWVLLGSGAGVAGVVALHQALLAAFQEDLSQGPEPAFTPHMTLLRAPQALAEQAIAPLEWTVREFVLLYNLVGSRGPYTVLGRWPLRG